MCVCVCVCVGVSVCISRTMNKLHLADTRRRPEEAGAIILRMLYTQNARTEGKPNSNPEGYNHWEKCTVSSGCPVFR